MGNGPPLYDCREKLRKAHGQDGGCMFIYSRNFRTRAIRWEKLL